MSTAPKYVPHYTVTDYQQWDGDWELWQGTPVAMSPSPSYRHQEVASETSGCLRDAIRAAGCPDCRVVSEMDWKISSGTVVRPDVSIVCRRPTGYFIESPPRLIVEVVSPSTAHKDRTAKKALYEQEGVGYYLIVDPEGRSIEAWQRGDGRFVPLELAGPILLELSADCRISPDFGSMFD